MEHSEQINELAAALAKAQGEMENVKKTSENPYFKSKYASLDAVWDTVRPILAKNGISVIQGPTRTEGSDVGVTTMLLHSSGQWIRSSLALPIGDKQTAQSVGSAITYGRRYGLSAMVGVASEEDDDAQNISMPAKKKAEPKKPADDGKKKILDELKTILSDSGQFTEDEISAYHKIVADTKGDITELTRVRNICREEMEERKVARKEAEREIEAVPEEAEGQPEIF